LTLFELNDLLRGLYAQLPRDSLASLNLDLPNLDKTLNVIMEAGEVAERRMRSEHKLALRKKLEDLLEFAKITQIFKERIIFALNMQYNFGVVTDERKYLGGSREPFKVGWMLDLDNPESGGIFDTDRAKDIEREGFKRAVRQRIGVDLEQPLESLIRSGEENQSLAEWRLDFIKLHGEEP